VPPFASVSQCRAGKQNGRASVVTVCRDGLDDRSDAEKRQTTKEVTMGGKCGHISSASMLVRHRNVILLTQKIEEEFVVE